MLVILRILEDADDVDSFYEALNRVRTLFAAYSSIEAREYVRAFVELKQEMDEAENDACTVGELAREVRDFNEVSGALAALAEAKSSDEFSDRLDELASPVGAWRLKSKESLWSITGLPGVRYGWYDYASPGMADTHEASYWGVGAPVGVQYSKPGFWFFESVGVLLSFMDVGNIINAPKDLQTASGRISGEVESSFSNVFTPGLYFTGALGDSPFNIVVGYSEGPGSGYRTLTSDSGDEYPVSRDSAVTISLSVDVTVFAFP